MTCRHPPQGAMGCVVISISLFPAMAMARIFLSGCWEEA